MRYETYTAEEVFDTKEEAEQFAEECRERLYGYGPTVHVYQEAETGKYRVTVGCYDSCD